MCLKFLIICFITTALTNTVYSAINFEADKPAVEIRSGKVEGKWRTSFEGKRYASFEGIPYAKPPVGDLRFQPPQPIDPWSETWKATQFHECMQIQPSLNPQLTGSEDCLYINVFVPNYTEPTNLDVLVHIHGGGFAWGSGTGFLDPFHMMARKWIFVTMNYRLGALGFLSTQDEVVSGNNGLKDQVLALKWIQENIASFGGNPDSVTLTGFSAGGASTHFHYLSPLSKNLFHRGFSISGTALSSWAFVEDPLKLNRALGESLSCNVSDNRVLVECLKTQSADDIVLKTNQMVRRFDIVAFGPVVEKVGEGAFLTKHPYSLLKNGEIFDVPWIASRTTEEGIAPYLFLMPHKEKKIEQNIYDTMKYVLGLDMVPKESLKNVVDKIIDFYLPNGTTFDKSNEANFVKLFTDRIGSVDIDQSIELHSKRTKSPVYSYQFYFRGYNSWQRDLGSYFIKGACHGDDMVYLFGGLMKKSLNAIETRLKHTMQRMLHTYVTTGTPSFPDVKWPPVDDKFNYLLIVGPDTIRPKTKTDYTIEEFWINLLQKFDKQKDEL